LILTLLAPMAAHAIVVTLVQIANTTANPAITQDTAHLASQIVSLRCTSPAPELNLCVQIGLHGQSTLSQYQVPPASHFAITDIEYNPISATGTDRLLISDASPTGTIFERQYLADATKPSALHLTTAIVMGEMAQPLATLESGQAFEVYLHGYLTAN